MQNTKTLLRRKEEQSEELKAFQSIVKATSVYVIWVQSIPGLKNMTGVVKKDFLSSCVWKQEEHTFFSLSLIYFSNLNANFGP